MEIAPGTYVTTPLHKYNHYGHLIIFDDGYNVTNISPFANDRNADYQDTNTTTTSYLFNISSGDRFRQAASRLNLTETVSDAIDKQLYHFGAIALNGSYASPASYVIPVWGPESLEHNSTDDRRDHLLSSLPSLLQGVIYWWDLVPFPIKSLVASTVGILISATLIYFSISCIYKPLRAIFERYCPCCV